MWPNPQETADLFTFTEEILNRKLHFFAQWDPISTELVGSIKDQSTKMECYVPLDFVELGKGKHGEIEFPSRYDISITRDENERK